MKNHITIPLTLVVAALIIGTATIALSTPSGNSSSVEPTVATQAPDAVISSVTVSSDNTAAVGGTNSRVINWQTTNYPVGSLVTINLIKKVSDNPISYEFVRAIAASTANDGVESWTPAADESGDAFYIEVVCASAQASASGCRATSAPARAL